MEVNEKLKLGLLQRFVLNEIGRHDDVNYYETEESESNANEIFDMVLKSEIVNQEWFDSRLKCTLPELLKDILEELWNINEKK